MVDETTPANEPNEQDEQTIEEPGAPAAEDPSNDGEGTPTAEGEGDSEESDELSSEQLRDALAKARTNAASYRTRLRAVEEQLTGMKSEEDIETLLSDIRGEREEAERALTRENVALKFGLPEELAEVLQGKSREEMEAHAKKLQQFAPAPVQGEGRGGLDPTNNDQEAFDPEATYKAIKESRRR